MQNITRKIATSFQTVICPVDESTISHVKPMSVPFDLSVQSNWVKQCVVT